MRSQEGIWRNFGSILKLLGSIFGRFRGIFGPPVGVELGLLSLLHIMLSWLPDARFMGLGVIFRGSERILESNLLGQFWLNKLHRRCFKVDIDVVDALKM